jgi:hypothetical protein
MGSSLSFGLSSAQLHAARPLEKCDTSSYSAGHLQGLREGDCENKESKARLKGGKLECVKQGICLLCVCAISLDLVAQSLIVSKGNYGLALSSPRGKVVSPELVSGVKCTLTNNTSKEIVGYALVWTAVTASGGRVQSGVSDRASPILQPSQSIDSASAGLMGSSPDDPIIAVEVAVDKVVFSDGSDAGTSQDSVAQAVPVIVKDTIYGVTISAPRAATLSPELISDFTCTLTNHTSKPVVSYVVLWTYWRASGDKSTSVAMVDASPIKSSAILYPNQSIETDSNASSSSPSANPFVKVEVGIDYLLFSDGLQVGKDTMKMGQQISYGKRTANSLRNQLLHLYQEKGLDALLQELETK